MQIEMEDVTRLKSTITRLGLGQGKQVSHLRDWITDEIERLRRMELVINTVIDEGDVTQSIFLSRFVPLVVEVAGQQVLEKKVEEDVVVLTTEPGPDCSDGTCCEG